MPSFMGFNGPIPFSIIHWSLGGEYRSKTVCYSIQEEVEAIARLHTPGDIYSTYEIGTVIRSDDSFFEVTKHVSRGA